MNQQTTGQETRIPLLQGWVGSCLLHGLLLVSFMPFFRQSLIPLPQEPFHWDVTLVESAPIAHKSIQAVDNAEPTSMSAPERAPIPAHANRPIQRAISQTTGTSSAASQTDAPVASESEQHIPSSPVPVAESTSASRSDEPAPSQPQTIEPPWQQAEASITSTTQKPSSPETVAAATQSSISTTEAAQPSPPPVAVSTADPASMTRPDYSWLQQAIFRRLDELKQSSQPFLDQSQPLKVLVRAVVSHEGALLEAEVVKSSGLDRIDQEAMALVQRAFPIQLDRTLNRRHVAMRIPITYSRE